MEPWAKPGFHRYQNEKFATMPHSRKPFLLSSAIHKVASSTSWINGRRIFDAKLSTGVAQGDPAGP